MSVESVQQLLRELQIDCPEIRVKDRRYKAAYSRAVWALVAQVSHQNEHLRKLTGLVEHLLQLKAARALPSTTSRRKKPLPVASLRRRSRAA